MKHQLDIDVREDKGITVLAVSGELDLATAPRLCRHLTGLRAGRPPRAVIDLSALTFCDSTGLRALLGEAREARVAGGWLAVVAPEGTPTRRLLEITATDRVLPTHEDVGAALARHRLSAA